jgi:hypothetical protein
LKKVDRAKKALRRAAAESDEIRRSLWLARTADLAIKANAVLVGGAAVNLHTGSYRPTDIDMCAYLDRADRQSLTDLGFRHLQGDHFEYTFPDGERWLLEFPDSQVDGSVSVIDLGDSEILNVISLESLIIDRVLQATDGTAGTFDEAVRLCVAAFRRADWPEVQREIEKRDSAETLLELRQTYTRVLQRTRTLLGE